MSDFVRYYQTGLEFYGAGHYDQALISLKKSIVEQPDFHDAYVMIARIYEEMERYDDAISIYEKVISLLPNDLEVLNSFARTLNKTGNERKAVSVLNKALKLNRRDVHARSELSRIYQQQGKARKALKLVEAGIKAVPEYAPFHVIAGDILRRQSKWNKAQTHYEKGLEQDPDNEAAKRGIDAVMRALEGNGAPSTPHNEEDEAREDLKVAATLYRRKEYDDAIVRLMDLKEKAPVAREATLLLGLAFTKRGLYKRAQDTFLSYLRHHPPDIRVLFNLGFSLNRMGLYEDAMESLNAALEHDSEFEEALIEMGIACQMTGSFTEAREYYVRALKMDKSNPRPYAYLALLAYDHDDPAKMKEFLKRAVKSDPDCADIALVKGSIMVRERNYADAITPLQDCLKSSPDHFEALKMMGKCRFELEDREGARQCYRAAAALNPSDTESDRMLLELG